MNFTGTGRHFIVKHEFKKKYTKLEVARARLLSHYQSANLMHCQQGPVSLFDDINFEVERSVSTIDVHYQQMTPPLGPCS